MKSYEETDNERDNRIYGPDEKDYVDQVLHLMEGLGTCFILTLTITVFAIILVLSFLGSR